MFNLRKHRTFDLQERLGHSIDNKRRIEFDRLPRKKVKPLWWVVMVFLIVLALYYYLFRF